MKLIFSATICILLSLLIAFCKNNSKPPKNLTGKSTIRVPSDYPSIKKAISVADDGDIILIEPGIYLENSIVIKKSLTICSEWNLYGDNSKIDKTVINSEDKILFTVESDGTEISGLTIINGDHTLNVEAKVSITHNHFKNNLDAISFEGSGGGYVAYNTVENDRDDGIDLDIRVGGENHGSDILIEHNTIINSNDDGVEIRLYDYENQDINYTLRDNLITGSKNAGIQIISYDIYTGKIFEIHHNIITSCKTGLGCMEGAKTREDLSGASKMDEMVWFYNNTLLNNQMGVTGGNRIIAFNNLVSGNSLGGFKRFGAASVAANNLFFKNGGDDFIEFNDSVILENNIYGKDPEVNPVTFIPLEGSPCVDAGLLSFKLKDNKEILLDRKYISGHNPDIGALESGSVDKAAMSIHQLIVDAGEDLVIKATEKGFLLRGRTVGVDTLFSTFWKLESGKGKVEIKDPTMLETEVNLSENGIYRFTLISSGSYNSVTDKVTVRYIKDGDGTGIFLDEGVEGYFNAEDYSYAYGDIKRMSDQQTGNDDYIAVSNSGEENLSMVEYTIGTGQEIDCSLWLLLKNNSREKSLLGIKLGELDPVIIPVRGGLKWKWARVLAGIKMTAGQWPLLISAETGSVLIDKIFITPDRGKKPVSTRLLD